MASSGVPGLDRIRELFTSAERAVLESTAGKSLVEASRKQLDATLAQARGLRDRWRDLHATQSRVAKRSGKGTATANSRSREKSDMFAAAKARREANSIRDPNMTYAKFREIMEGAGGFVYAGWNGDPAIEAKVKEETKATIRCIPDPEFRSPEAPAKCLVTGEPAKHEVVWAKAY